MIMNEINPPSELSSLMTPALVLDRPKLKANASRMAQHAKKLGCPIRPHVKTHKSAMVLADIFAAGNCNGITVSTLHEASYFFSAGYNNILYAVGMGPNKMAQAAELIRQGCELTCITDSIEMVNTLDVAARHHQVILPILIEIDVDSHRAGVAPDGELLLQLAYTLSTAKNLHFKGIMTHAGGSYKCDSVKKIQAHAVHEREATILAASRIKDMGLTVPVVSIGSTPTALMTNDLSGITELRCGVYAFFDLFQAGLGVCNIEDIVISVLTNVIGHQKERNWVIVDAGWMALSRDRGTSGQQIDQGYGLICDVKGDLISDAVMISANQEHGVIASRPGTPLLSLEQFPVGSFVRVLPNHACATAAQYDSYHVCEQNNVTDLWSRTNGWS